MNTFISARTNKNIVEATKLKDKKYRDKENKYTFEGRKLFLDAVASNVNFDAIFMTEKAYSQNKKVLDSTNAPLYTVTENVFEKLSDDKSPDGIFCICNKSTKSTTDDTTRKFIVCSVRDPGNMGTIIRSARAFGIEELILHDCVDIYNPKVIRSSMGAFFRQNITLENNIFSRINSLIDEGYNLFPTALNDKSVSLNKIDITEKTVFIIGNEGHGLSDEMINACNNNAVIIPMVGDTESLNASIAASLLMWEMSHTY